MPRGDEGSHGSSCRIVYRAWRPRRRDSACRGFAAHGLCIRFGLLRGLAAPVDCGATFNGIRIFGENKTYRGIVCVAVGTAVGFVLIRPSVVPPNLQGGLSLVSLALLGFAVGTAAMLAELPNSPLKRQLGIGPGRQARGLKGASQTDRRGPCGSSAR